MKEENLTKFGPAAVYLNLTIPLSAQHGDFNQIYAERTNEVKLSSRLEPGFRLLQKDILSGFPNDF